jgi:hypothetical protein
MKYLSFVRTSEKYREAKPPTAMMEAMGELIERPTTDGPFVESKELIGGWAILKADSSAEIVRLATEFMDLHRKHWPEFEGECEVRPIEFLASDARSVR